MTLRDHYRPGKVVLSFEFFPPKTSAGERALWQHVDQLMRFVPDYVTCTYGAGGSTRDKTLGIVSELKRRFRVPVASHLTLVGSTIDQLREYLHAARQQHIDYIVALRGDPPQGQSDFQAVPGGLTYANELVELIRSEFSDFGIAVAGYPETHREAISPQADLENLCRKVACGADVVITQLFFNNVDYFSFKQRCGESGIDVPIVPGILPLTSLQQAQRITSMCGASLPQHLITALSECDSDSEQAEVGIRWAMDQVYELLEADVDGLHFYVLNQSTATCRILDQLQQQMVK